MGMINNGAREGKSHYRKEARLWGLVFFWAVMLPIIMYPGNLGPIAMVIGFIVYALPASAIGFLLGKIFGSPRLANRICLVGLGIGMSAYGFYYLITH